MKQLNGGENFPKSTLKSLLQYFWCIIKVPLWNSTYILEYRLFIQMRPGRLLYGGNLLQHSGFIGKFANSRLVRVYR